MGTNRLNLVTGGREALNPSMRNFPVAFPACSVRSVFKMVGCKAQHTGISYLAFVASDAIILNYFNRRAQRFNNFRFRPRGENGRMVQPILGFEEVFVKYIVMRHMAVVAMGHFPVGAMIPGNVLGSHDVAIDTSLRVIGKIGGSVAEA